MLDNILHHVNTTNSTWPDCVEDGKDFMGDDLLAGLRFSREDCAEWCNSLNSRCDRWVYKEIGTQCHLKYIAGEERNLTNPLTPQDRERIAALTPQSDKVTTAMPANANSSAATGANATESGNATTTASPSGSSKQDKGYFTVLGK